RSSFLSLSLASDDLPVIDTDSDLDEPEEDAEKDSGQQISDCESSDHKQEDFPLQSANVKEPEISGYVSDGEDVGSTLTSSRLDSEIFPPQTGEGSKRSVSDWVRSAQAMLQTPQKPIDRQSKTPEDSAKKKRNGGLAERLCRLQCRQRSAVSFWKHHANCSDTKMDRPGVLVLEVLEVHEECSMQLAHCEQRQPPGDGHQHSNPVSEERARVLVLFNRETAAQLIPAARDIIHIHPPWLCVLVQDGYGTFSVVQLHLLPREDDLSRYRQMWQGRNCVLRGIKVVQRVTRERSCRLFSLIDSLWPPAMPLKDHGNTLSIRPVGPAPSFCYLLSGQQSSVEPTEPQTESPLYRHPATRTLQDVLQVNSFSHTTTCRCTFTATVLYKRITDVGQGEVWLVLTDPSLQEEQPETPRRRTVALCVNASCALTSSVLEALNSPAVCRMSFTDAIKERGKVCPVEPEALLESTTGPLQSLAEPQAETLPRPVRLDPLSAETTPNSLCTLTGVIVGVDENTAFSWPACNHCGSDGLERPAEGLCASCKTAVDKPDTKIQLEVFLTSSLLTVVHVFSLLNRLLQFPGYDVENVLGKEVGPIPAYVRAVTRKPALWIGLEEIHLRINPQASAGSKDLHTGASL
uniref:Scaffold protein involved in DNA repair n=1 Tax=Stegastes partitus TaxID=144197 RepID=A0A3B5AHB9_9TELE